MTTEQDKPDWLRERLREHMDLTGQLRGQLQAAEERERRLLAFWADTEARSADAHHVYQIEAHRRGDVRHPDAYEDLSEATKEWDRVLVRWVEASIRTALSAPPAEAEKWRVGRSVGRTLYLDNKLVGLMDTPELAAQVVDALNADRPTEKPEGVDPATERCSYRFCDGIRCALPLGHDGYHADAPPRPAEPTKKGQP